MRKIETQMNTAIRNRKDFRSGNTEVAQFICSATNRAGAIVKLHGNKIAEVYANSIVIQRNFDWFLTYKHLKEDFVSGMEVAL